MKLPAWCVDALDRAGGRLDAYLGVADPPYDAILLVSFGGPEGPEEVMPFLEKVVRGRGVPRARLIEVAEHYYHFGGRSPINDQNRDLIAALERTLAQQGPNLPIYWGNRNWHPLLDDALAAMAKDGVHRAIAFVTAAFSSYSSCRQYRENIAEAAAKAGPNAPTVDKIRSFFNHPCFVEAVADRLAEALRKLPRGRAQPPRIVFTAHSIPDSMARNCSYANQIREAARLASEAAKSRHWEVAYQSRSGPPQVPWLEPDICDRLEELRDEGVTQVCVVPIGFLSDHLEVLYDLDVEAAQHAGALGMDFVRAGTVGVHPSFVRAVRDLIYERVAHLPVRECTGAMPAVPDNCPADCCLPPAGGPVRSR